MGKMSSSSSWSSSGSKSSSTIMFRVVIILVAVFVIFALIAFYRNWMLKQEQQQLQQQQQQMLPRRESFEEPTYEPYYGENHRVVTSAAQDTNGYLSSPYDVASMQPSGSSMDAKESFSQGGLMGNNNGNMGVDMGGGAMSAGYVQPNESLDNEMYRPVEGYGNNNDLANSSNNNPLVAGKRTTIEDLLPGDANGKWAQVTMSGQGELNNVNLVNAAWHIGINTQGQSMRNANMQLRSDPIIPKLNVSPWNKSTIEPDTNRRALEIM